VGDEGIFSLGFERPQVKQECADAGGCSWDIRGGSL